MSSESPKSLDAVRGRIAPYSLWLLIALVATNLLALYSLAIHSRPGSEQFYISHAGTSPSAAKLDETLQNLEVTQRELLQVKQELSESLTLLDAVSRGKTAAAADDCQCFISKRDDFPRADEFQKLVTPQMLPLGFSSQLKTDAVVSPVGHSCLMHKEDLEEYMQYTAGGPCPDDEVLTQKLLTGGCEPLPRRRCFARMSSNYSEPFPVPESFWTPPPDDNIIWTAYSCKSFECLNARKKKKVFADCLDCFDLQGRESERWKPSAGGNGLDLAIEEVLSFKPGGSIRIGLDIGGGGGTFAVRMREHDVTIVTTSLNLDGPFNNFIALRGVIPLYLTVSQRFPFFDNTLDIVHSMHVLSNWIPLGMFDFILFDIDRILRPGGLFWLDHFFCLENQLNDVYIPMIEKLGYKKLRWTVGKKLDRGPELTERYLTAVLEKPKARS